MERILALQALSTNTTSFNEELAASTESNVCSSESAGGCSSQSAACQTVDQGTVGFW
jgi:hypothetical protein